MDILKNTDAMGKRIFADLEKINFIRTSTSAEETRAANIIKDELAKEGMEATIEEFMVETADIHKVSLKALGKEWEIKGYRRSGSTPPEGLTAEFAYVQQGNDIDLYDKKGKIVLVNSGRLNEEVYEKLVRYGVAGPGRKRAALLGTALRHHSRRCSACHRCDGAGQRRTGNGDLHPDSGRCDPSIQKRSAADQRHRGHQ